MRFLAAIGALVFLYLALIPAALLWSTLDSACAGEGCEASVASSALFTLLYAGCVVALLGTAALFTHHAFSGSLVTQQRVPRGLAASMALIAVTTFALFAFAYPRGALIALFVAASAFVVLIARRHIERRGRFP